MRRIETFYDSGRVFLKVEEPVGCMWGVYSQSEALTLVREEIRKLKSILEILEGHDVL